MRVLITGGAGYIGSFICSVLEKNSSIKQIIVLDNLSNNNFNLFLGPNKFKNPEKFKFIYGDLLDTKLLENITEDIDCVLHLAAKTSPIYSDLVSHEYEQTNNWGTAGLVYACQKNKVKKFVYFSTVSVYSKDNNSNLFNVKPTTSYGLSKLRGEKQTIAFEDTTKCFILRLGNVYGFSNAMRFDSVINKFLFDANFQKKVFIQGTGDQIRPFIYIENIGIVIDNIINDKINNGTYDLVQHNFSIVEIYEVIKNLYPDLEAIFVNQHIELSSIERDPNFNLSRFYKFHSLNENLESLKKTFTF